MAWALAGAALLAATPLALSANEALAGERPSASRLVTLELQSVELERALNLFGELGGYNIVLRRPIPGHVTARFRNTPWREAFASLLRSQHLVAEFEGNLIYVEKAE